MSSLLPWQSPYRPPLLGWSPFDLIARFQVIPYVLRGQDATWWQFFLHAGALACLVMVFK